MGGRHHSVLKGGGEGTMAPPTPLLLPGDAHDTKGHTHIQMKCRFGGGGGGGGGALCLTEAARLGDKW